MVLCPKIKTTRNKSVGVEFNENYPFHSPFVTPEARCEVFIVLITAFSDNSFTLGLSDVAAGEAYKQLFLYKKQIL